MTVSVVMPAFNAAETIEESVRSVLAQTDPDLEVVVVDDGSTDETAAIVRRFSDPRLRLVTQENRGASAARNAGIAASVGDWVCFIDSDDLWLPRYLEQMGAALNANPQAGFAYTDAWVLDGPTGRVARTSAMHWQRPPAAPPEDADAFLALLIRRNFVYTSIAVPRSVVEEVGGFDERLNAAIDYDFSLRIVASGRPATVVPGRLCVYRRARSGSISSNRVRVLTDLVTVYDKLEQSQLLSGANLRVVQSARNRIARQLAVASGERGLVTSWLRLRSRLAPVKAAALHGDAFYDRPPDELVTALPEVFGRHDPN